VEPHSNSRIEYMIKAKSQFKSRSIANNVEIIIPVPSDVDSPSFKCSIGTVVYLPDRDCVVWSIKQFNGSREYLMRAHFGLPSISAEEPEHWRAPIEVQFEIPYFTVSGIQVKKKKKRRRKGKLLCSVCPSFFLCLCSCCYYCCYCCNATIFNFTNCKRMCNIHMYTKKNV
jgi:AP-1 complex subunit mu